MRRARRRLPAVENSAAARQASPYWHCPATHCPPAHGLPSATGVCTQPSVVSQLSAVHGLLSVQVFVPGVPHLLTPPELPHSGPVWQPSPSPHANPAGSGTVTHLSAAQKLVGA